MAEPRGDGRKGESTQQHRRATAASAVEGLVLSLLAPARDTAPPSMSRTVVVRAAGAAAEGTPLARLNVNLESDLAMVRVANRWSRRFEVPRDEILRAFADLSVVAHSELSEWRQRRCEGSQKDESVADIARCFWDDVLRVEWHRDGRRVWCTGMRFRQGGRRGVEMRVGDLGLQHTPEWLERVDGSREAAEMRSALTGRLPGGYRTLVSLFRAAVEAHASRACLRLPDVRDLEEDPSLRQREVLEAVARVVCEPRSYTGPRGSSVSGSWGAFARGMLADGRWREMGATGLWARAVRTGGGSDVVRNERELGARGETMVSLMRWTRGVRVLATVLRKAGVCKTDGRVYADGEQRRMWVLGAGFAAHVLGDCEEEPQAAETRQQVVSTRTVDRKDGGDTPPKTRQKARHKTRERGVHV